MFGYIKLGVAITKTKIADCKYNAEQILEAVNKAGKEHVKLLVFPELTVTGYSCGDLFFQKLLIDECEKNVQTIIEKTKNVDTVIVIGIPVSSGSGIYNCAAVIHMGRILGIVPKEILPAHPGFSEKRWFISGAEHKKDTIKYCGLEIPFGNLLFKCSNYDNFIFSAEICADFWNVLPPSSYYCIMGATVCVNLSASPSWTGRHKNRTSMIKSHTQRCKCAYLYAGASIGESSADVVFDGHGIIADNGRIAKESKRYSSDTEIIWDEVDLDSLIVSRTKWSMFEGKSALQNVSTVEFRFLEQDNIPPDVVLPKSPYMPKNDVKDTCIDIFQMQVCGLFKRLTHTGIKKPIIGVSGGLDSTLALLVAAGASDKAGQSRDNVLGITMPGFGTSGRTYNNAINLMKELNISTKEISIKEACIQHFSDIGHDPSVFDTTYENAQARERTQILMDVANMVSGLVVGTGDMSELALGWATYNGDHMSMYAVNSGVPKTIIRNVIQVIIDENMFGAPVSKILSDILSTPVSPELLPTDKEGKIAQKTEDLVGPYELHDYFMYYVVYKGFDPKKILYLAEKTFEGIYDAETIKKWLKVFYKRFFSQQFKRSCMPDGPKVVEFSVSTRGDLSVPSDASGAEWLWAVEQ